MLTLIQPLTITPDSWAATAGGNWFTASDWSTGAAPTASNAATIAATGTYTVSVTTPDVAASLLIDDSGAKLADAGTLTLAGALSITAGIFALQSGGSLVGGTISTGSAGVFSAQGGALDGSTYRGTLSVGASQALYVAGGLTLEGAGGAGAGYVSLAKGALLNVLDTETLDNGTLSLAGSGATLEIGGNNRPSAALTLGSGFTILQSGSGQNDLTAGYYQNYPNYIGDSITNNGTISVTGGTLTAQSTDDNGIFTNAGIIEVSAGEFQIYYDGFTNTGSVAISGTGALDVYQSSLTFGGGNITTSGSGAVIDDSGGTLLGTISSATNIDFNGGSLAGVTWQGPFSLGASQSVTVSNGLTLTGSGSLALASGAEMDLTGGLVGATSLSLADGAGLDVLDTETLNNGTLTFTGAGAALEIGYNYVQDTLTLGSNFTILQSSSGQNDLTDVGFYNAGGYYQGDSITNDGTISVTGGVLTADGGSYNGIFTNAGVIHVSDGELQLDGASFINAGSIAISGAGVLDVLNSSLTFGAGGSISTTGSGTIIDDSGGTLLGTISSATNIDFNGGSLAGVTWQGPFSLGASQSVTISNGLTLTGSGSLALASGAAMDLTGGLAGATSLSLADGALLDVGDTETLDNATLTLAGSGATLEIGGNYRPPAALTLGSGFTILQSGSGQNYLTAGYYRNYPNYTGDSITNNGTVSVTGGTLTAYSSGDDGTFTNAGVIGVSAGEFQLYYDGFANTGSVAISGTGALDVLNSSLTFGAAGSISTTGSGTVIDDSGGTLFGTISSATNIDFAGGSLAGVTWQGPFSLGASQSVVVSNGLTLTGSGSLALASGAGMDLSGGLAGVTSLSLADGAGLDVLDTETLTNGTLNFTGAGATLESGYNDGPQTTLTLGSGFAIAQASGQNTLTDGYYDNGGYFGDSIVNNGTIAVTGGTLTVNSTGGNGIFTNSGLIDVGGAGTFDLTSIGKLTNVSGSTLTGGIFEAGAGASLLLAENVTIATDASTLILSGTGSTIESYNSTTGTDATLDKTLRTIASTGALKIVAGRIFSAGGAFTDNGLLQLGGGSFTASAGLTVASTGTLTGFGTVNANVADAGLVLASGGTLTLEGAISGAGSLGAAAGATLDLTTAETLTPGFTGAGTIKLDGGAYSLPAGAAISVGTIAVGSGASLSGYGTLTGALANNGTVNVTSATLLIDGAVTGAGTFQMSSGATLDLAGGGSFGGAIDGNGGALYIDGSAAVVLQAGASLGNENIVVDAGATLELTQGGNLNGDIVGAGTLQLDGSTGYNFNGSNGFDPEVGTLLVDSGASLGASGEIAQNLEVLGSLSITTGTLTVGDALSGSGSVSIGAGALLDLAGFNATGTDVLPTLIAGAGTLQLATASSFAGGTLGVGTVLVDASLAASGTITGAVTVDGTLEATGLLALTGGFTGDGMLQADAGAVLDIAGGGTLGGSITGAGTLQLDSGTFSLDGAGSSVSTILVDAGATLAASGGSLLVQGALTGAGAVQIAGGALLDLAGGGTLTGAVSGAGTLQIDGAAPLVLASGSTLSVGAAVIDAGATLVAYANETLPDTISGAGTLALDGNFTLGSAIPAVGTVAVLAGASLSGAGTLTGGLADSGSVAATGTLLIDGALSGAGTLGAAATKSLLDIGGGGSFGGKITGNGTLRLDGATPLILDAASVSMATLLIDAGAALEGDGAVGSTITNKGTIEAMGGKLTITHAVAGALEAAAGATLDLTAGGTVGAVSGAGTLALGAAYTLVIPVLAVGAVSVAAGASLTGTGRISGALADNGLVTASSGTLNLAGALSGAGTLSAASGAVASIAKGGTFSGALTGAGGVAIGAATTLSGSASLSAANVLLTASLTQSAGVNLTNAAGNMLTITAASGKTVSVTGKSPDSFTNAGSLVADGAGTASLNVAFINSGNISNTSGTLSFLGSVANAGTIAAAAGLTSFAATVGGTGTLDLGAASTLTLNLGTGAGQTVDFLATSGVLDLAKPLDFLGTITGFGGADQIDLLKTAETSFNYANNVLTVIDGKKTVAALSFTGDSNSFSLASDNHGGTLITFG